MERLYQVIYNIFKENKKLNIRQDIDIRLSSVEVQDKLDIFKKSKNLVNLDASPEGAGFYC